MRSSDQLKPIAHLHVHAVRTTRGYNPQIRFTLYDDRLRPESNPKILGQLQIQESRAWLMYKLLKTGAAMVGITFSTSGNYNGGHPDSRPAG